MPRGRPKKRAKRKLKGGRVAKDKRYGIVKQLNYNGFHCFKEKFMKTLSMTATTDGDACYSPGAPGGGFGAASWKFQLNDLGDLADYGALFDQYRITGVKIKIFPQFTQSITPWSTTGSDGTGTVATASVTQPLPNLWYTYDTNDANNPANIGAVLEKDPKMVRFNKPVSIWIANPHVLSTTTKDANSSINVGNMVRRPVRSPWLAFTTDGTSTSHLGVELGLFGAQASQRYNMRAVVTYYFQTKGNV